MSLLSFPPSFFFLLLNSLFPLFSSIFSLVGISPKGTASHVTHHFSLNILRPSNFFFTRHSPPAICFWGREIPASNSYQAIFPSLYYFHFFTIPLSLFSSSLFTISSLFFRSKTKHDNTKSVLGGTLESAGVLKMKVFLIYKSHVGSTQCKKTFLGLKIFGKRDSYCRFFYCSKLKLFC